MSTVAAGVVSMAVLLVPVAIIGCMIDSRQIVLFPYVKMVVFGC